MPAAKRAVGVRMSRGYKRVGYLPRLGAPFLLVLVACAVAMQSKTDPQHVSAAAAAVAPGMIVMVVIYVAGRVGTALANAMRENRKKRQMHVMLQFCQWQRLASQ